MVNKFWHFMIWDGLFLWGDAFPAETPAPYCWVEAAGGKGAHYPRSKPAYERRWERARR